jgi:MinD superfamily P-loop ATPase
MNRKEFLIKVTAAVVLGGLAITGYAQQNTVKYSVLEKRCDGCGHCFHACREKALLVSDKGKAVIDQVKCKGCGDCIRYCRKMAIVETPKNRRS